MYEKKIESARQIISTHNDKIGESQAIDFDAFASKLEAEGGTSEDGLRQCSWEDLEKFGLPRILARQVAKIFRKDPNGDSGTTYVSSKKAQMMTPKELLELYNPLDSKNTVAKRLKEISDGKRCLVFNSNGSVNVEESGKVIKDVLTGLEETEMVFVKGKPCPTYRVGERPDAFAEENPLYPGRPLRNEESCDQTGRSWQGVPLVVRQLLYLAITDTGELEIDSVSKAHDVMDKAVSQNAEEDIRRRYPEASVLFDKAQGLGELPTLKVALGIKGQSKKSDPFFHKTY